MQYTKNHPDILSKMIQKLNEFNRKTVPLPDSA